MIAIGKFAANFVVLNMSVTEKKSNSSQGGARAHAGRKRGTPNKKTAELQKQVAESGLTPLEYMLDVMRYSGDEKMRMSAAQAAAPYIHAKLSTIDLKAEVTGEVKIEHSMRPKLTRQQWLDSLAVKA